MVQWRELPGLRRCPALHPGDILIMDNLGGHRGDIFDVARTASLNRFAKQTSSRSTPYPNSAARFICSLIPLQTLENNSSAISKVCVTPAYSFQL